MAYIITGATGHIGNNIVKKLVGLNEEVIVLVRKIDESIKDLNVIYKVGNIFDNEFLENIITSNDIVIHLAGVIDIKNNKKEQTLKINYEGTKIITDVCIKKMVKRYIYFSTVDCIYKKENEVIAEPNDIYPQYFSDNYSYSKALATKYVLDCSKKKEIPINILYPSAVIGKNDFKPSAIGKVIQDIINGKIQFGINGGYNFVDVDDVVQATINICQNNIEGDYLLTGEDITVYELYDITNKHLKRDKKTIKIPLFIVKLFIPFIPYLSSFVLKTIVENHNYDNSKMVNILEVNNTPFDITIDKTIKFFEERETNNEKDN